MTQGSDIDYTPVLLYFVFLLLVALLTGCSAELELEVESSEPSEVTFGTAQVGPVEFRGHTLVAVWIEGFRKGGVGLEHIPQLCPACDGEARK